MKYFIILASIFIAVSTEKPQNPNVLFILADDAGFESGCYLNKIIQTPNLDSLARRSLLFNRAFTSVSSCSPSRAAILTGQPSHQSGMYGLHHAENHFNAFDGIKSVPNILREQKHVRTGLIGKKHVGPSEVFKFDYEATEENHSINQVGRNITKIKLLVRDFLKESNDSQFFLMVALHDPHRCGHITPQFGPFCELFGNGEEGMGTIPDWQPIYYQWDQIPLPYNMPDTEPARRDVAAQYTTISRLDQGIGLILKELEDAGRSKDTLIVYTSDNGPPFPSGRTNLYEPGFNIPLMISSPDRKRWHQISFAMTSHLDLMPTFLDWFGIQPELNTNEVRSFTGKSLLPILDKEPPSDSTPVYGSHTFHEVTMSYPMRSIRTNRYKLIHNINYNSPFPIDQDFYVSWTFKDILNRTISKVQLPWYKTLKSYYYRPEFELYDLKADPMELVNVAERKDFAKIRKELEEKLSGFQIETKDPWRCAPNGVLEGDKCLTLGHDEI